jgi:hypothetical protein
MSKYYSGTVSPFQEEMMEHHKYLGCGGANVFCKVEVQALLQESLVVMKEVQMHHENRSVQEFE